MPPFAVESFALTKVTVKVLLVSIVTCLIDSLPFTGTSRLLPSSDGSVTLDAVMFRAASTEASAKSSQEDQRICLLPRVGRHMME
jgi:hypothetical protein